MTKEQIETPPIIEMEIDCLVAMCIIGNIQLACRHHLNVGPSRLIAENFARELQKRVAYHWPDKAVVMEMGWNPDFDIR